MLKMSNLTFFQNQTGIFMTEDLKRLLEEINKKNEMILFFKNLWKENSIQAKLFLLHREQLFYSEDKVIFPYIFWSNVQKENERKTVLKIATELEEIKRQQALNRLGFETLLNGMKDLFAYYLIKVIRANDDLKRLILDKAFSFRKMKEILGNYDKINLDVLNQEEIENIPELSAVIKRNVIRFKRNFDFTKLFEILSSISGITTTLPLMGIPHQNKLLKITGIKHDEYTDLINELYVLKLIANFQTLFWCERCLDAPQIFVTLSGIDPDHMQMKCPKCRKSMLVSSIYNVDNLLKNCILFRDGLLVVALGWLFNQKKVKWNFSVHNKYENDFICETKDGKMLFECKMHMIPKDERSFKGQLEKDLNLLIAHVQTLLKEGILFKNVYLVYNYDLEEYYNEVEKILGLPKLKENITKYKIKPIGFPEILSVLNGNNFIN
jgi:hypothetical protein